MFKLFKLLDKLLVHKELDDHMMFLVQRVLDVQLVELSSMRNQRRKG